MSIVSEITRLQNAKSSIKTAIENKGVTVGDGLIDTYASKIDEIQAGGSDLEINDCAYLFYFGHKVDQLSDILDLCKNVTTTEYMFGFGIINQMAGTIDLSKLDMSKVTNAKNMFYGSSALTSIIGINQFDMSKVTNITGMFTRCQNLTSLDLSNWNTSNVENFNETFASCTNLSNLNINNWNLNKATNLYGMFQYCSNLTSLDLSNWNTSNVYNMKRMFSGCTKLSNLNLSNWNTSKVTDMSYMFNNFNTSGEFPDVSSFDTSNVNDMSYMFSQCGYMASKDLTVDISNFNGSKLTNNMYMFYSCYKLKKIIINNPNVFPMTNTNMLDNCPAYIYVPDDLVDTYKSTTNWSTYADRIKGVSELEA